MNESFYQDCALKCFHIHIYIYIFFIILNANFFHAETKLQLKYQPQTWHFFPRIQNSNKIKIGYLKDMKNEM